MPPILVVVICFALYLVGYLFYSRFLSTKLFELRPDQPTPAHTLEDGVDYVPTHRLVLFGHHYASITGLSPMLGPAIAVIWGWLPAMLWVVLGALLVGCVHDFGALVVSARARGMSIGVIAESLMGKRAKSLMHAIIFFAIALAMGVFAYVVALLFSAGPTPETTYYPESVVPSAVILILALTIGWLVRRRGMNLWVLIAVAFVVTLVVVIASPLMPVKWGSVAGWTWILLAYAWLASVLPVWSLLQPRDFLNSLLLYLGLGLTYIGFFVLRPEFVSPVIDTHPEGAPPIYPFVFIVIACGAASGFHSLVSSGTTAKQLDRETDARPIGYGAMVGESLLGLASVLACTAGFVSVDAWKHHYHDWSSIQGLGSSMSAFIEGSTRFVATLGIPEATARTLIAVVVVSFALTTLDSATRLLRYNIEEIGATLRLRFLRNRYTTSTLAVGAISFFAFYKIEGRSAGLALWQLFGSTNQLLAGLALLVVSLYLIQRRRFSLPYLLPMLFMMVTTIIAMANKLRSYAADGNTTLLVVGGIISAIAVWLVVEAVLALRRYARSEPVSGLDVDLPEGA
ncbi:MAG: carbon starvation protein A [Holophagae bacterium]|jgi:carbon starvation protein